MIFWKREFLLHNINIFTSLNLHRIMAEQLNKNATGNINIDGKFELAIYKLGIMHAIPVTVVLALYEVLGAQYLLKVFVREKSVKMPSKSHETPRFSLPKRLGAIAENIWIEYVQLDREYKPANLGIGYADYLVTEQFNKVLAEVAANADSSLIQYAPPKVRESIGSLA